MSYRQANLPGVSRADHSNQGADFEKELETVHDFYRLQRVADIRKIPHRWAQISESEFQKIKLKLPASMLATTADGKRMQRMKSDVDFVGGGQYKGSGFHIAFDAKSVAGSRFPFANVESHQLRNLRERTRVGAIAGLMIRFNWDNRVFFAPAEFLDVRYETMIRASYGKRTAPRGTASLSIQNLEEFCLEIFPDKKNGLLDYLPNVISFARNI